MESPKMPTWYPFPPISPSAIGFNVLRGSGLKQVSSWGSSKDSVFPSEGLSHIGPRPLIEYVLDCQSRQQKHLHVFVIDNGVWNHLLLKLKLSTPGGGPPEEVFRCFWWQKLLLWRRINVFDHKNSSLKKYECFWLQKQLPHWKIMFLLTKSCGDLHKSTC